MYTYADLTPDLHLVAIGVVVWVVAVSIAFGVYIPFMRSDGKLLRGFAPRRARADLPAYVPMALRVVQDLDHAPLPVDPSADAPALPAPAFLAPVVHQVVDRAAARPAAPIGAPPAPERPATFSVLIVDDNLINRQVLEIILDSAGIAHASVEDGLKAVEAMRACAYDAVLMDLHMPVMDGFEATRQIRALEAAREAAWGGQPARIIVVSANCADEDVAAGRAAGADRHLAKPVSAADVIGELAACPTVDRLAA